jgi:predicted transcriptional regulator
MAVYKDIIMENGTKGLLDIDSGVIYAFDPNDVCSKNERDFDKVFKDKLAKMLALACSKSTDMIAYILRKKNKDNVLYVTQFEIAEAVGMSSRAVNTTMEKLISNDFIRKYRHGAYMINPEVMYFGHYSAKKHMLKEWDSCKARKKSRSKKNDKTADNPLLQNAD